MEDDAAVLARCRTALAMLQDPVHMRKLATGAPGIDKCLGGGIPTGGLTEVCVVRAGGKEGLRAVGQFLLSL